MMDPLRTETCWSTFKYFIILIVSTYYILCIGWIVKCLIIIDARCKHEDCLKTVHYHSVETLLLAAVEECTLYNAVFVNKGRGSRG
jgi:hypothetical protein